MLKGIYELSIFLSHSYYCQYRNNNFVFEILEEDEIEKLKKTEQKLIETLKPTYNDKNAKGLDIERYKESNKESQKTEKGKKSHKKACNKYNNQLCSYNGETITINTLRARFRRAGVEHPTQEAKKYLIKKETKTPIEFYDVYP